MEQVERHNLAIRNFIATIVRKPIIGSTLVSALKDMQIISKHIFKLQQQPERAADFVRDYVQESKLDNFANRPADIGKFLAWTEEIRWPRAYVETFTHCAGMLNCGVLDHESLDALSPTTRALLEHSCTHMHYRLSSAEVHMTMFGIDAIVLAELEHHAGIKDSLLAFQDFLRQYYAQIYGTWPPPVHQNSGHWLTRSVGRRLQQDFGSLYDLLVDKEVHTGVSTSAFANSFGCTLDRRQLLSSWDRQNGFKSISHSTPKAPDHCPTMVVEQEEDKGARRSSLIPAIQKHRKKAPDLHDIYTRATNNEALCKDLIPTLFVCRLTQPNSVDLLQSLLKPRNLDQARTDGHARRPSRTLDHRLLHDAAPLQSHHRRPRPSLHARSGISSQRGP